MMEVHRTHQAKICNHAQVADSLDRHGWSASKLWNVANYHSRQEWEATGEIPDHSDLKTELKTHNNSKGLHSQSNPVSAFLRNSLKPSTRGTPVVMTGTIRPATAKKLLRPTGSPRPRRAPTFDRDVEAERHQTRHQEQPCSALKRRESQTTPESVGIHAY